MRLQRVIGAAAAVLLGASAAHAREYSVPVAVENEEELHDLADAEELAEEELELLLALFSRPMDLNRADRYALYDLPGLTWGQVDAIIARRVELEGFSSVDDLAEVPGMTEGMVNALRPFVVVSQVVEGKAVRPVNGSARTGVLVERALGADLRQTATPDKPPSGYLSLQATGFDNYGAGVQLIVRPLVSPNWDQSIGFFSDDGDACPPDAPTACFKDHVLLKGAYLTGEFGPWRIVVGTYNVGFGQRLTIDTTRKDNPRMWDERMAFTVDRDDGAVRPVSNLRGAAVSLDGVDTPIGWLDATAFVSYQSRDVYRDDLWALGDSYNPSVSCQTDGDCPSGYSCQENGLCTSIRVYDEVSGKQFSNPTFNDAFSELMGGGNVTFNFDERVSVGVTGYRSHVSFNYPEEAGMRFASGSKYPNRSDFGAASIDGRFGMAWFDAGAEVGMTHRGNLAGVVRLVANPLDWLEVTSTSRWYDRDYDNPHSRASAAATETFGSRRRNERGSKLDISLRPLRPLRLLTSVDFYDRTWEDQYLNQALNWVENPVAYLRIRQRATYEVTKLEELGFQFDYANNDLAENGRGSRCVSRLNPDGTPAEDCGSYVSEDYRSFDTGDEQQTAENRLRIKEIGRGEKLRFQLSVVSTRLAGVRLSLKGVFSLVDQPQAEFDDSFAMEGYVRFAASRALWTGARAWGAFKLWPAQVGSNTDDELMTYVGLSQRLFDGAFGGQIVYGVTGNTRTAGFDFRHFGSLQLEARF